MLKRVSDFKYIIERESAMRVPGVVYISEKMLKDVGEEPLRQVTNVAALPGIEKASFAMPDIHWGYGFPIGGVAAFNTDEGIISPGGVGYDINCGVRLVNTSLMFEDIKDRVDDLANALFNAIPAGVGSTGDITLKEKELKRAVERGAEWAVAQGLGEAGDIERIEDNGRLRFDSVAGDVSKTAFERGADELGTLGAGNHFLEVQRVDEIFMPGLADRWGICKGGIMVMIHTGSRGFGYQICDDFLKILRQASVKYGISLPDSQLACAPLSSTEGKRYINAMNAAANYAWANRQILTARARGVFEKVFRAGSSSLGMDVIYDISHNIARLETHEVEGKARPLFVHRKGATRALPAGHPLLGNEFKDTGHPVMLPGDMGRPSFVLVAGENAEDTFYSTSHGAGRLLSRHEALKRGRGMDIAADLKSEGVIVSARTRKLLSEEAPFAYKDAADVVDVVEAAGIARKVARMRPLAVIKG